MIISCPGQHNNPGPLLVLIMRMTKERGISIRVTIISGGYRKGYNIDNSDTNNGPFVGNVVKVRSNQEEIESNIETGGERIESIVEIEGDRTGYNVETKGNGTK